MKKFKLIREEMLNELGPAATLMPANNLAKFDPKPGLKFPTDKQIPQMIIFKRKAIRVYPDNQKVALYYSEQLNQFITIPFGGSVQFNEAVYSKRTKLFPKSRAEVRQSRIKRIKQKNSDTEQKDSYSEPTYKKKQNPYIDPIPSGWEGVGDVGARIVGLAAKAALGTLKTAGGYARAIGMGAKEGWQDAMKRNSQSSQISETFDRHLSQIEENSILGTAAEIGSNIFNKAKDAVVAAGSKAKDVAISAASSAANTINNIGANKSGTDFDLGPVQVKGVPFRANAIVKKSRPERQTAQGGTSSPTQEIQYRNAMMKQNIRENDILEIAESFQLKITEKTAQKILSLYESLNASNRKQIKEMLTKDVDGFKKVIEFTDKVNL